MAAVTGRQRRGFTLAEMLIAVSLAALLMGSAAVFVHAAFHSREQNTESLDLTRLGRFIMNRVLTDIRHADNAALEADGTRLVLTLPDTGEGEETVTVEASGAALTYSGQVASDTAVTETLVDGTDVVLSQFTVTLTAGADAEGNPCVECVSIVLGLRSGEHSLSLTGSACPRRNQSY